MRAPCRECPFRRKSAPGWLGEHESINEIIDMIYADHAFPIDFDEAFNQGEHCHGALIFMNNSAKLSLDLNIVALQKKAGKDTENVFNWRHEAVAHHEKFKKK